MKCICEKVKYGYPELLSSCNQNALYLKKDEEYYYIEAVGDGIAILGIEYCPFCGRYLEEDDE